MNLQMRHTIMATVFEKNQLEEKHVWRKRNLLVAEKASLLSRTKLPLIVSPP